MSGEVIALVSAFFWAVASVLLTMSARQLHVLPLNLIRCAVASLFFWSLLPFYGGLRALTEIPLSAWLWLTVSVVGLLVIGDSFYFRAMDLAGVSWAMPLASITPLWVVLLAGLLIGEPLTWPLFLGAALVVLGVALVSRSGNEGETGTSRSSQERRRGLWLALWASFCWAIGQLALKPGTAGMHSVVANCIRQPMGMLLLMGPSLLHGRWRELGQLDRKSWMILIAASLIGTGIGTLLFITAIQMAGAGRASVLTTVSPLMAVPFSILWLHERPTLWTLAGILLTISGIALVM